MIHKDLKVTITFPGESTLEDVVDPVSGTTVGYLWKDKPATVLDVTNYVTDLAILPAVPKEDTDG